MKKAIRGTVLAHHVYSTAPKKDITLFSGSSQMFNWFKKSNLKREIEALKRIGDKHRARSQNVKEWR